MKLVNKTIVITGATKGLGKEIAIHLSQKYSNLILIARSKSSLDVLQKEIQKLSGRTPMIINCDISNENDVVHMSKIIQNEFNHIDVLINNAGIAVHRVSEQITSGEMRKQFETNVFGTFYCIKSLLPLLKNSESGYILNVGSLASQIPFSDNSVYASTKSAISCLSAGLYLELKKVKIKVGLFVPGIMNTSFQEDRKEGLSRIELFLSLNPQKAALYIAKMISKRKKKAVMHRWMLLFMKMKQLVTD